MKTTDLHQIAHELITLAGRRTLAADLALPPLDLAQLRAAVAQLAETTSANIEAATPPPGFNPAAADAE